MAHVKTKDLQSGWVIGLMMLNLVMPAASAQSQSSSSALPNAPASAAATVSTPAPPAPALTEPYGLRPTDQDYSKSKRQFPNPFAAFTETAVPPARLTNSSRTDTLYRDGKIYLSLDDAIHAGSSEWYEISRLRATTWTLRIRTFCVPTPAWPTSASIQAW